MANKAILRKTIDPRKLSAVTIKGESMIIYPASDPQDTPICLMSFGGPGNISEARQIAANPDRLVTMLNESEMEYDTHIRYRLLA